MHGVISKVLNDLTRDHKIEVIIRVWEPVALRVEMIDVTGKLTIAKLHGLAVSAAERAVVAAAHLLVPANALEQRGDLHITAKLEHTPFFLRRRHERQCSSQSRNVFFKVRPRTRVRRRHKSKRILTLLQAARIECSLIRAVSLYTQAVIDIV